MSLYFSKFKRIYQQILDIRSYFGIYLIMTSKDSEKENAIKLRKQGYSYTEILKEINVSKATLSGWLRNIKLNDIQSERLRSKNECARHLGSIALRNNRINKTKKIIEAAKSEINMINDTNLKIIGAVLYWAEGSKQNENRPSKELIFTNSDPKMIKIYLLWLNKCLFVKPENIKFEIYIHETYKKTPGVLSFYWSSVTGFPINMLSKIYFKKNKVNSIRKNKGDSYHGVLRITVKKSTDLSRKVMGLVEGICLQTGVIH